MVSLDRATVCRLKRRGKNYEILVDPDKAFEFKKRGGINIDEILAFPAVYHDARRGEAETIPKNELQEVFGTTDIYKIAEKILREGELQFTTEQRRVFVERVKREIAEIISKRSINPQTNTPHPPQRILNAMEEAGVHVEPFVDAELQVKNVIEKIKEILPIKLQLVTLRITIPPEFVGRVYSILKKIKSDFKEEWLNDGSLQATIEIPAGIQDELLSKIGNLTKGNFKSEIIKRVDM